jgi:hypothetical protein
VDTGGSEIGIASNGEKGLGDKLDLVTQNRRLPPAQGYVTIANSQRVLITDQNGMASHHRENEDGRSSMHFDSDRFGEINRAKYLPFGHTGELKNSGSTRDFNTTDSHKIDPDELRINANYDLMRRRIDEFFNSELEEKAFRTKVVTVAAASFTVGIVGFLLRAGSLIASLMSTLPLWKGFDPIAVFARSKRKKKTQNDTSSKAESKGENLFEGEAQ